MLVPVPPIPLELTEARVVVAADAAAATSLNRAATGRPTLRAIRIGAFVPTSPTTRATINPLETALRRRLALLAELSRVVATFDTAVPPAAPPAPRAARARFSP